MEENSPLTEEKKITVTSSTETVEQVVSLMERLKVFIDKHGIKGAFQTLLMLFVAAVMGYFIINPNKVFEAFENFSTEKHDELVKARLNADPYIKVGLNNLKDDINADRVFLLETHNGGNNLTNMPFLYVDMTYAQPNSVFDDLELEYKNIRLLKYPLASLIYEDGYWCGSLDDIMNIDPELYYRLQKEDVAYIGMMLMYGKNSMPSGVIGIVYTSEDNILSRAKIVSALQKYTNIISPLLSVENIDE